MLEERRLPKTVTLPGDSQECSPEQIKKCYGDDEGILHCVE